MAQDRIAASPQSPVLGALARHLRAARSLGDEARIPLIDMGLGELLLGKAPEEIEEWSYGNLPFQQGREGIGSRIPQLKRGRAEGFMDATMGALDVAGIGALARRGLTAAAGSAGTRFAANPTPQIGAVKLRGGNWLDRSVERSLEPLLEAVGETDPVRLAELRAAMGNPELGRSGEALGAWIKGPLTKYVKRDMATPEDPVRRLAEEGVTHFGFPEGVYLPAGIQAARDIAGFPKKGLATSRAAQSWETLADLAADPMAAGEYVQNPRLLAENPWLSKLDPEAHVYGMPRGSQVELGLDHLVDELSNAMNPESGLPRNLLLRPEQMQQMGMEKAVRHVDAINKWRADQKATANAELANKAAVLREYPDTPEMPNPKGLRWVELKAPDGTSSAYLGGREYEDPAANELAKQLKYEGDTMGHCVGGYCPDVLEGRSRIFSLRDAKGEPHVTVEVENPRPRSQANPDYFLNHVLPKISGNQQAGDELFARVAAENGFNDVPKALEKAIRESPKYQEWVLGQDPANLVQVKGKQNLKPKDEYLPFVQDFLRNSPVGEWGSVSDLKNTGLRDMRALYGEEYPSDLSRFMTEKEQGQFNINYPRVNTRLGRELDAGIDWEPDDGYAAGGLVDGGIDDPVQFALQWRELVDAENGYRRA